MYIVVLKQDLWCPQLKLEPTVTASFSTSGVILSILEGIAAFPFPVVFITFLKFLRETETHFTSRHSFYDDFRYINFSRTLVNEGNGFDIRDGIFRVPVTGLYMFTVHALPMEDRPFMVQIHLNDQSVAAFSNGESGTFPFG